MNLFLKGMLRALQSSTGKIRYMINNYHEAMAICRHYGNPNLFITFTCNVGWPEIQREIKEHRSYKTEGKPYIVTLRESFKSGSEAQLIL